LQNKHIDERWWWWCHKKKKLELKNIYWVSKGFNFFSICDIT
jgi:hypothetical protein